LELGLYKGHGAVIFCYIQYIFHLYMNRVSPSLDISRNLTTPRTSLISGIKS
jgi:hypothetical protein